jgi:hypothetical protein
LAAVGKDILDQLSQQMNAAQREQFNAVRLALGGDVKHATDLMNSVYDRQDITRQVLTKMANGDVDGAQAVWIEYIAAAKKQLKD